MSDEPELFTVPIAIREDLTVKVQIPPDLTAAEAERISRILMSYASRTEPAQPL